MNNNSYNILVVEDDINLRESLVDNLELEGYSVASAGTIKEAKAKVSDKAVDLIVLDIMLPDGDGYSFSKSIQKQADSLVLMLTARTLEQDVIEGFLSGADDYVAKPYRSAELLLRIKALLRRRTTSSGAAKSSHSDISMINGFEVNWSLREINKDGNMIHLTKTAFDMFVFLFKHQNQALSRDDILNQVWGENIYVESRTVDNFISNLKKTLNLNPENQYSIKGIRGVGYSLVKNG